METTRKVLLCLMKLWMRLCGRGRDSGESGASAKVHAPYLVTRGLVKGYGEGAARMEVLRGIDVEIARGEICVLLGPSGSGKSTF